MNNTNTEGNLSIIKNYPDALENRELLNALLLDIYPGDRKKVNLLLIAFDAGIPNILSAEKSLDNLTLMRFKKTLEEEYGIATIYSKDIIIEWANALSIDIDIEINKETNEISEFTDIMFIPKFSGFWGISDEEFVGEYIKFSKNIKKNPLDYDSRNRIIVMLQSHYCFRPLEHYSWEREFRTEIDDKLKGFDLLREISNFYSLKKVGETMQSLRMEAWNLLMEAECSLYMGEFFRSIKAYNRFLNHSIVKHSVRMMDASKWWTDLFSFSDSQTILKVICNMGQIFKLFNMEHRTSELYTKFKNIIKYEYESAERISKKSDVSAETALSIREQTDKLCGLAPENNIIYTLSLGSYFKDIRPLLNIGFEHPEEPVRIKLDNEIEMDSDVTEIVFHDDIYTNGFSRLWKSEINFDLETEKINLYFNLGGI